METPDLTTKTGQELGDLLGHVKLLYSHGVMSREQAKEASKPVLDEINTRGQAIAKKHGRRHNPINFTGAMR